MVKAGILSFHATPNFGAVLQAHALARVLGELGAEAEIINYVPVGAVGAYGRSLFLGRRRSARNVGRILAFGRFFRTRARLSGPPIITHFGLRRLAHRYDIVFTGSDEIWKIDHIRQFNPAFYGSFVDPAQTRLCAYGASMGPDAVGAVAGQSCLLRRYHAISVRDPWTGCMVQQAIGSAPIEVLDPTLLIDWPRSQARSGMAPFIALYGWPDDAAVAALHVFAARAGLDIRCIGCRHRTVAWSHLGIGPLDWVELMGASKLIVTDHFHGLAFALALGVPVFAYSDPAKRGKLSHLANLVNFSLAERLESISACDPEAVLARPDGHKLVEMRRRSRHFLADQIDAARQQFQPPAFAVG